jgi:hypothetical protein
MMSVIKDIEIVSKVNEVVGKGVEFSEYSSEDVLVMVSLVSVMNEIGKLEEDVKLVVDVPSVLEIAGVGVQ